ncbi:endonuclease/exonuclease/phosphatase family protein [uncultured Aquimarina sp.]|uniref:endonuclease/exonuclease/phosphatase family protein n=1 Tax=uncultured Aquimarina sp. TaxID=575652 RepID=UPI0026270932|nr:endonuclease/exonuclease/phosphatase family protein [uncultured Aquimarina sp.]
MKLRIAVYNVNWMRKLFHTDGTPITTGDIGKRSQQLASITKTINPDFIGIIEGPDTLVDGSKTASIQLEKWASHYALNNNFKGIHGHPSSGQQELCALYDSSKIKVAFTPTTDSKNQFNEPFLVDTTNKLIKEQYKHYRPPLELTINNLADEHFSKIIIAHTKSKGIFAPVDYAKFEQISERDRMRLYAECMSIRKKCNDYIEEGHNVIVMGDINDGIGMDFYENRFNKSALEILLGDVWEQEMILTSVLPKPKWTSNGWEPSSSRYRDRITEDYINVLIDHILISNKLKLAEAKVWNPYLEKEDNIIQSISKDLKAASDHFPVVAEIETT